MTRQVLILLICIFSSLIRCIFTYSFRCQDTPQSCTCYTNVEYGDYITCSNLDNELELANIADSIKGKEYIYSVVIDNSTLKYIPSDAFAETKFVKLDIRNTHLMSLSDADVAFVGLEDHLEELYMNNCSYMNELDWSVLNNLRRLDRLVVFGGDLESINDLEKVNIATLIDVSFLHNNIKCLHEMAFANLTDLKLLYLKNNKIEVLKRSMLPNPALELLAIDVSYNKIEKFPVDMFDNMPNLEYLSIAANRIMTLDQETFSAVLQTIEYFDALSIGLRCDCRVKWIKNQKLPEVFWATCEYPEELKGKGLLYISSKFLWCFWK